MSHPNQKKEYLTKDHLNRAAKQGVQEASKRAKKTATSLVTVKDGWVVREFKDGSVRKIKKLPTVSTNEIKRKVEKLVIG